MSRMKINKANSTYTKHQVGVRLLRRNRHIFSGLIILFAALGCDTQSDHPMSQTVPVEFENWQSEIQDAYNDLSNDEQQLLSRYMQRMQLSDAQQQGATTQVTIDEAIEQQRKYEELHPNNPIGQKTDENRELQRDQYPITLLPYKPSDTDTLNNVKLSFVMTNKSNVPVDGFKGTLMLNHPDFAKPKPVVISLVDFNPPLAPNANYEFDADVNISDAKVYEAIKHPQNISIEVTKGSLTLKDGHTMDFE